MNRLAGPLVIALGCWGTLGAQNPARATTPPSVTAMGEATVTAKPDQALLEIGVVTQDKSAAAAAAQNAGRTDAVLADLRKALGSNGDIKTTNYSVTPDYQYPRPGGAAVISSYTATNVVQVTTTDLALVGKLIDTATQGGANRIESLEFGLKNDQPARTEALREAAVQARANAQAMAASLGLRVLRVLSVEQGESRPIQPVPVAEFAAARAAPTPINPGTITVRATVTVRMEVGQ